MFLRAQKRPGSSFEIGYFCNRIGTKLSLMVILLYVRFTRETGQSSDIAGTAAHDSKRTYGTVTRANAVRSRGLPLDLGQRMMLGEAFAQEILSLLVLAEALLQHGTRACRAFD